MPTPSRAAVLAVLLSSSATTACAGADARVRLVAPNRPPSGELHLHVGDTQQPDGFHPIALVIGTGGFNAEEILEVMSARAREVGCTELFVVPPHGPPFTTQRSTGVCGVAPETDP